MDRWPDRFFTAYLAGINVSLTGLEEAFLAKPAGKASQAELQNVLEGLRSGTMQFRRINLEIE